MNFLTEGTVLIATRRRSLQAGMALIELMIAMTLLVTGALAVVALTSTAIASNNRNKLDTGATLLAQTVLEQIAAQPGDSAITLSITDCNPGTPNAWSVATAAAASPGAGANLVSSTGAIDYAQQYASVPANYKMLYVTCGANGTQSTYDVRWNVQAIADIPNSKLVSVAARQIAAATNSGTQLRFFALPVTLRTIVAK